MSEIILTLAASRVLAALIISCGTVGCKLSIGLLRAVNSDVTLSSVGLDENGGWRMGVFGRLTEYAGKRGLTALDVADVVSYFAGADHIEFFRHYPAAGLGEYVGPNAGLVSHVLLPLDSDLVYRNAGTEVSFGGSEICYNEGESGTPCYHLGVVIYIDISAKQLAAIKAEQAASEPFVNALKALKGPIVPPPEYLEALASTINAVARD